MDLLDTTFTLPEVLGIAVIIVCITIYIARPDIVLKLTNKQPEPTPLSSTISVLPSISPSSQQIAKPINTITVTPSDAYTKTLELEVPYGTPSTGNIMFTISNMKLIAGSNVILDDSTVESITYEPTTAEHVAKYPTTSLLKLGTRPPNQVVLDGHFRKLVIKFKTKQPLHTVYIYSTFNDTNNLNIEGAVLRFKNEANQLILNDVMLNRSQFQIVQLDLKFKGVGLLTAKNYVSDSDLKAGKAFDPKDYPDIYK